MSRFSSSSSFFLIGAAVLASTFVSANAHAIVGSAQRDTTEPGVVAVLIQHEKDPTPETSFMCSGTLIAPHVVLTAAHCVHEKFVGTGQSFYAFFGDDVDDSAQLDDRKNFGYAKSVTIHPDFDPSSVPTGGGPSIGGASPPAHDVAIIVLLDKAPGVPRPLMRALDDSAVGGDVRAFGYGQTKAGDVNTSGRRYAMTTTLARLTDDHVVTKSDSSLCEGDSGGPSFIIGKDNVARIAGVHSYVEHATSCSGENFDARIDREAAWIDGLIEAADPGFSAEPTIDPNANQGDAPSPVGDGNAAPSSDPPKATTTTTSGCSLGSPANHHASAPIALVAALGLGAVIRSRRSRGRPAGMDRRSLT